MRSCAEANAATLAARLAASDAWKKYKTSKSFGAKIALERSAVAAVATQAKRRALRTLDTFTVAV